MTGLLITGKENVGVIVQTCVVALQLGSDAGMLKLIMSAPAAPLARSIASRSDPAPLLFVLVTVKVAAWAVGSNHFQPARTTMKVATAIRLSAVRRFLLRIIMAHLSRCFVRRSNSKSF